ncbi:MAG: hypothetical protein ACYS1A_14985 [Planctomycetota bacterium]|jgi:N-acetylglucosamine-6-phosphate deacetylase
MKTVLLKGGFVVTPEAVVRSDIVLCEGRIELGGGETQSEKVVDITGKYVVPGFVDIHFHGYNLFEFTVGLYDKKKDSFEDSRATYEQGFEMLSRKLAEFGVTGFYVASGTDSIETLKMCYSRLADYLSKAESRPAGARLLGGLLEGPFINPNMSGAMNPELVLEPAKDIFDSIEDGGSIKLANVAPDAGRKSCELTEYLTDKGIVVGAGHTNATCEQVSDAVKSGLKYCIHFTNGPTGGSYKPFKGGGAVEAVLKFDELYAEQICDGFHINPAYVLDIIKRKGIDKILGITDCSYVVGSGVKEFSIGGVRGAVSDDGTHLRVVGKVNTLFGSTLTMNRGFANLLNWLTTDMQGIWNRRHEGFGLEEALVAAARIFSTNPCVLTDRAEEGFGSIVDGAKADLCVLDVTGSAGEYKVTVESTIVEGNTVYATK